MKNMCSGGSKREKTPAGTETLQKWDPGGCTRICIRLSPALSSSPDDGNDLKEKLMPYFHGIKSIPDPGVKKLESGSQARAATCQQGVVSRWVTTCMGCNSTSDRALTAWAQNEYHCCLTSTFWMLCKMPFVAHPQPTTMHEGNSGNPSSGLAKLTQYESTAYPL